MPSTFIKEINDDKIALSLKFEDTNPWANAREKFAVGVIVTGKVARMTDFGAFVEIEPGVDALLHVSQIARHHVEKPADELKIGQEIEAKIVDFNEDEKKISLSIKALLPEEDETEENTVETVTEDVVEETAESAEETTEAVEDTVEEVSEEMPEETAEENTEEAVEETVEETTADAE